MFPISRIGLVILHDKVDLMRLISSSKVPICSLAVMCVNDAAGAAYKLLSEKGSRLLPNTAI